MYSVRVRQSATVIAAAAAAKDAGQERDGSRSRQPGVLTPTRPLHSYFTVGRIDLDEDQLGGERVLLVDDRNGHVYLWCGQLSTFKHRGFGLEAASALKADNPKGGQVRRGRGWEWNEGKVCECVCVLVLERERERQKCIEERSNEIMDS